MLPVASSSSEVSIRINNAADVARAQRVARELARTIGFEISAQWQLATAVSEAATNMLKFAQGGLVTLVAINDPALGMEFQAMDDGPGFSDVTLALRDGVSEGRERYAAEDIRRFRGLGLGLGAIQRLTDELWIGNRPGGGALVRARKYLR